MAAERTQPRGIHPVYILLLTLGVAATLTAFSLIGLIAHQYVTRVELREPPQTEQVEEHGEMPSLSLYL